MNHDMRERLQVDAIAALADRDCLWLSQDCGDPLGIFALGSGFVRVPSGFSKSEGCREITLKPTVGWLMLPVR